MTPPTQRVTSSSTSSCHTSVGNGPTRSCDIKGSTVLTCMVVLLCHGRYTSSPGRSIRPTRQCRSQTASGRHGFSRSGASIGSSVSPIRTTGLALRGAGSRPGDPRNTETQGGVHREAPYGSCSSRPETGKAQRANHQRACRAGFEGVPAAPGSPFSRWTIDRSNWTTSSTAWAKPILLRPIGCWCRNVSD